MAVRKTTKTRSRQKRAPEPEGTIAIVSPNGDPATAASAAKNGLSPSFEQIQRRAYELFVARGATHGRDWADWFTAEQELTASSPRGD
jgi:putative SOS response-associated peptidase YedK